MGQGSILDLMGGEGLVVIPGTAPHCGTFTKRQFITEVAAPFMSRFSRPPIPLPSKIVADGDEVIVVAAAEGETLNGSVYRNNYVFILEFRGEELVRATEHLDMVAFNQVWDRVSLTAQTTRNQGQLDETTVTRTRPTDVQMDEAMLHLRKSTTALIVIDLQEGILQPEPLPFGREQIVRLAATLGHAFVQAGSPIIVTTTDFASGYADAPRGIADAPWVLPKEGLPAEFAHLVPEVNSLPAVVHIRKRQMSAFFGTELDLQLRRRRCDTVVICGVATNMGVEATARAAFDLNYNVIVASDACATVAPGLHEFAMEKILPRVSRVRQTQQIVDAMQQ